MIPRRIALTIEYDGTAFHGWQVQPGLRTVQGSIQTALSRMMLEPVTVIGSGRTDAGVHALGQVAHADITRTIPPRNIMMGLNSSLERDVRILDCRDVDPRFHARFSALGKTYRYRIRNAPTPTALDRHRVWHIRRPLELPAMAQAAAHLRGRHDFTSFKSSGDGTGAERNLRTLTISPAREELHLEFEADGFLKHMVRNITGALVEVGSGNLEPDDLRSILEARTRNKAPPKAPPQGLTLVRVDY